MKQIVIFFKSGNVMKLDVKGEVKWSQRSGNLTDLSADSLEGYGAYVNSSEVEAFKIINPPLFGGTKGAV